MYSVMMITPVHVRVYAVVLLAILSPSGCNDLALYRAYCPYTDFCTMDSVLDLQATSSEEGSCCMDCFCDDDCFAYDDCCPDIGLLRPRPNDTVRIRCVSTVVLPKDELKDAEYYAQFSSRYKMFNFCPDDYTDTDGTVDKCEEKDPNFPATLDDAMVVSDSNDRVYKNKYCALCHGARDVTRWDLTVTQCRDALSTLRLKSSEVALYTLHNCSLLSSPPPTLALTSRLLPCNNPLTSTCPDSAPSNGVGNDIIEECENGTHMPFVESLNFIYKNAFCYQCNVPEGHDLTCNSLESTGLRTSPGGGLSNLLKFHEAPSIEENSECSESEILDYHTNECRAVHCPPYEAVSYGTCQPFISHDGNYIDLRMVFTTPEPISVNQPVRRYNDSLERYYGRKFRALYRDFNCKNINIYVYINMERDSYVFTNIEVVMEIETGPKCSIEDISDSARSQTAVTEPWVINDKVVRMRGRFTFFRSQVPDHVPYINSVLLYDIQDSFVRRILQQFFLCPYIVFDMPLYNAFQDRMLGLKSKHLVELSVSTDTISGTFVLSEGEIAVCIDTYIPERNSASGVFSLHSIVIAALLHIFVPLITN